MRISAAARSAGFIHGHGPSSNALPRGLDRAHRVLGGGLRDAADRLLGGGVDHVDLAAALAFGPLTVDEEVVVPRRAHGFSLVTCECPAGRRPSDRPLRTNPGQH